MEQQSTSPADRRNRVDRLKKMILSGLFLTILILIVLCACLLYGVLDLRKRMAAQEERSSAALSRQEELRNRYEQQNSELSRQLQEAINRLQKMEEQEEEEVQEVVQPQAEVEHKVYLTFDDGPSKHTMEILDILDRYDVKATFFILGKEDETSRERVREIVNRGHSIGMHSYAHKYEDVYTSLEGFEEDLEKIHNYILETTGVDTRLYRFPGGSSNKVSDLDMQLLVNYLAQHGYTHYDWNVLSGDADKTPPTAAQMVVNATETIYKYDTAIVLMHDTAAKDWTVEALPQIIETILAMENTEILPITEETKPIQHVKVIEEIPSDEEEAIETVNTDTTDNNEVSDV